MTDQPHNDPTPEQQPSATEPLPETGLPQTPTPPETTPEWARNRLDLAPLTQVVDRIKMELRKVIIGQEALSDQLLMALFCGGHVLIEGVPGVAKTLTAKLLARTVQVDFQRIQFTPDLMPSDVVGTTVFNMKDSEFSFNPGPIFSNVVLIDEINRAPAKTQAALFEVMEEYQVTVDGETYPMSQPFFVLATQNPIEQEGTYKLPEAQLDRFLFKINVPYPALQEERAILRRFRQDFKQRIVDEVRGVVTAADVAACRALVEQIHIGDELLDYIAAIVHETRESTDLFLGASPRASLAIMMSAKAHAALQERDFVTPDDIQHVAYPVLNHRVVLTPEREMEGYAARDVIEQLVKRVEVPR